MKGSRPILISGLVIGLLAGSTVEATAREAPRSTVAQVPVADYWVEWTDHKTSSRSRTRWAIQNAKRAGPKAARFYQKLVGVNNDELKWLANHQPEPCYADEYEKWRRAVKNLHTVHRNTARFLRAGNAAGVRRSMAAQKAGIKRLNKAAKTVSNCAGSAPPPIPPGNPFVGKWQTRDEHVNKDGFYDATPVTLKIGAGGGFLFRDERNWFCRENGLGTVPLTYRGMGEFVTGGGPQFRAHGPTYCHPRSGRKPMAPGGASALFRYDADADVLAYDEFASCWWRAKTGSPKDCKAFWQGTAH